MSVPPTAGGLLRRPGGRRIPTGLLILVALLAAIALERRGGHGAAPPLAAVAFSDASHGVGLFVASGASRCVASAAATADGGARFDRLAVLADWPCAGSAPIADIATDGRGDAFAYGPRLYATHDGGARWTRVPEAGAVLAIAPRGRSLWMALSVCRHGGGCRLRVMRSADGGRRWSPAARQPGIAASAAPPGAAAATSVLVRTGADRAYALSASALAATTDGGASWSRRAAPCAGASTVVLAVPPGGAPLLALCAGEPSAGSQLKWLEVSADGGRGWTWRGPCGRAITPACERSPLTAGYLGALVATSPSTLFAIGDRSGLIVTRDGGRSWRNLQASVGDVNGTPAQVAFFGPLDGIVLGRRNTASAPVAIWHTSDGGRSWHAVTPAAAS